MISRRRILIPLTDPEFHRMYIEALKASEKAGWFYSEDRTRPYKDHLALYFWREAA